MQVPFVACSGAPVCKNRVYLPRGTLAAELADTICGVCQHGVVRKLALRCERLITLQIAAFSPCSRRLC